MDAGHGPALLIALMTSGAERFGFSWVFLGFLGFFQNQKPKSAPYYDYLAVLRLGLLLEGYQTAVARAPMLAMSPDALNSRTSFLT